MTMFKRLRLALCCAACCVPWAGTALAAELAIPSVTIPAIAESGTSASAFVPNGWKLEQEAKGDLNKDGLDDLAMVLHQENPANVLTHDGLGENPLDTNPRLLVVAFAHGQEFRKALSNSTLIPRRTSPTLEDPFVGVEMDRGSLLVSLTEFANAGSWSTFNAKLRFRHDGSRFTLIGYDRTSTNRGSGEMDFMSVNYLLGKAEQSKGRIDTEAITDKRVRRLGRKALLDVDQVGDGLAFVPFPGADEE